MASADLRRVVRLRVAAVLLHQERTGRSRDSVRGPAYIEQLNDAARLLSETLDVYHVARGKIAPVPRGEIAGGMFADGGNILRTAGGTLYRQLAVRRSQAVAAINALGPARETYSRLPGRASSRARTSTSASRQSSSS